MFLKYLQYDFVHVKKTHLIILYVSIFIIEVTPYNYYKIQ